MQRLIEILRLGKNLLRKEKQGDKFMAESNSRNELEDEFWNLRFGLKRSYFYHEKRVLFWRMALFIAHGAEMALTSTAAAFLFNETSKSFSQWAVLISAVLSFIVVWFGADKRIQTNMQKKPDLLTSKIKSQ